MAELTKQWLQQKIADMEATRDDIPFGLGEDGTNTLAALRIALASLEAEPVAYSLIFRNMDGVLNDYVNANTTFSTIEKAQAYGRGGNYVRQNDGSLQWVSDPSLDPVVVPLFTAPPAPVSVPDERYQHLSELYHAQEKRLFKLAQRIKGASFDKYAYSPSQAIDVLESAIFGEREDECLAAMLQGAEQQQNQQQNIPEDIPGTLFKPVADLYGLTSPTGSETSFTFDAVEARDFVDGGWSCQEYVELERFQEAITNHTEDKLAMVDHSGDSNNMVERVSQSYKLPEEKGASLQLRNLIRKRHAEWSDSTFGNVGPIGPLKHLSKEALEAAAEPDDLSEWADMQFLLWDAQRRAGISDGEITAAMEEKLKVNMARQWPEPKDGEPRLHIKAAPQQEVNP